MGRARLGTRAFSSTAGTIIGLVPFVIGLILFLGYLLLRSWEKRSFDELNGLREEIRAFQKESIQLRKAALAFSPDGKFIALCGAKPGRRSAGWYGDDIMDYHGEISCKRCLAKMKRLGLVEVSTPEAAEVRQRRVVEVE
jgi:hypothetical protein